MYNRMVWMIIRMDLADNRNFLYLNTGVIT